MNIEKKTEEDYCLMGLASILLKRPVSCLSLIALPLLHIFGLHFLHLLLTSVALFLSSFFFHFSFSSSKQYHNQEQDQEQEQDQDQDRDYLAIEDIKGKSEEKLEMAIGEDEDGAIPDDESLIELSLPSGHYLGHHYSNNKDNLYIHNKIQDFRVFDVFTEFNDLIEEDNLIEIDISIGSIKYSRFEIKA